MKTIVTKWGNSLAVRIPKAFAVQIGVEVDSEVDLTIDRDAMVVRRPAMQLKNLLASVTEKNVHQETDTGPSTGREVW